MKVEGMTPTNADRLAAAGWRQSSRLRLTSLPLPEGMSEEDLLFWHHPETGTEYSERAALAELAGKKKGK
jgi:hypothetical protein